MEQFSLLCSILLGIYYGTIVHAAGACGGTRKCAGTIDCPDSATICASKDRTKQLKGSIQTARVEIGLCVCPEEITGPHKTRYACATDAECASQFKETNLQCQTPGLKCCAPLPSRKIGYCRRPSAAELNDAPDGDDSAEIAADVQR